MPPPATYEDLARLLELPLLAPELTGDQVVEGLELARRLGIGGVLVRPCDIDLAVRTLGVSAIRAGAACGFPHGTQSTAVKLYEARDLLRRGARAIDAALGLPRLLTREFQHVQAELLQLAETCHKEGAILTVILESSGLTDELKIIACRAAERAEADFVSTGTGYAAHPGTIEDVRLVRKHVPEEVGVKAVGAETLDAALEAIEAGATRILTASAAGILEEFKRRQSPPSPPAAS